MQPLPEQDSRRLIGFSHMGLLSLDHDCESFYGIMSCGIEFFIFKVDQIHVLLASYDLIFVQGSIQQRAKLERWPSSL